MVTFLLSVRNKLLVTGFHSVSNPGYYVKGGQEQVRNTEIKGSFFICKSLF